jgi:glycosyltransferase involved in cell wall biosynthesis
VVVVSVVVPTHDREHFLPQTLRSISRQHDVDLEVLVVDDGSPFGQVEAIVAALDDDRIRLLRNEPAQGVSVARNRGIAAARGDWVAFCDDDDLWAADKLREQLDAAGHAWPGWIYTGSVNVNEAGKVVGGRPPLHPSQVVALLPQRNVVPGGGSAVLVHRRLLDRAGPFDLRLHNTEDWDLWVRLSRLETPRRVAAPLVGYRVHSAGSSLVTRQILLGAEEIERRYGGPLDRVTLYRHLGRLSARGGRRREALRWYARTARLSAEYWHDGLLFDAAELLGTGRARLMARRLRLLAPAQRDAAVSAYLSEAQRWLDELAWRHL